MKQKLILQQETLRNITSVEPQQSNKIEQFVTNVAVCPCSLALAKKG